MAVPCLLHGHLFRVGYNGNTVFHGPFHSRKVTVLIMCFSCMCRFRCRFGWKQLGRWDESTGRQRLKDESRSWEWFRELGVGCEETT